MLNEYEKYLEAEAEKHQVKERLSPGAKVFVLEDNNLIPAEVVKISNRSAKVKILAGKDTDLITNYPYIKIAKEGDSVVIAWETWRGNAARGGYRIERTAYENLRMPVEIIPKKLFVFEEDLCKSQKVYQDKFLSVAKNYPNAALALGILGAKVKPN